MASTWLGWHVESSELKYLQIFHSIAQSQNNFISLSHSDVLGAGEWIKRRPRKSLRVKVRRCRSIIGEESFRLDRGEIRRRRYFNKQRWRLQVTDTTSNSFSSVSQSSPRLFLDSLGFSTKATKWMMNWKRLLMWIWWERFIVPEQLSRQWKIASSAMSLILTRSLDISFHSLLRMLRATILTQHQSMEWLRQVKSSDKSLLVQNIKIGFVSRVCHLAKSKLTWWKLQAFKVQLKNISLLFNFSIQKTLLRALFTFSLLLSELTSRNWQSDPLEREHR